MLATLVVTLCAALEPTLCETHSYEIELAAPICFVPADLARVSRPGWRIARWRCEMDRTQS